MYEIYFYSRKQKNKIILYTKYIDELFFLNYQYVLIGLGNIIYVIDSIFIRK